VLELATDHINSAINHLWYEDFLTSPLLLLTLSLAAFQLSSLLYRRLNNFPLLHPTIVGAALVAAFLHVLDINYQHYKDGNQLLMFWLGPATVALAVPLYQQLHLIRKMALPILLIFSSGAFFAAISAIVIAYYLGANEITLLSLAPKSVTTPIAISIADEIGGLTTLAAGAVAFSAATGIALAPIIFRLLKITDPKIRGFCIGITAHGMGTGKAFEENPTAGAFASLAMCLTGTLSAFLIPVIVIWLQ
jgi:putative effector of murein hydrolase